MTYPNSYRQLSVPQQFGINLRRARRQRRLTQVQLAERAGVSQTAISRLEAGDRDPLLTTVVRLAKALGVKEADLVP
jgi:uncharacterized protein